MKSTVKTVSFMMIATLFSKVAGLLRDVFIAAKYGTESMEAVAYSYASSLPIQLFDFTLGAAVLATFIPIFNGYMEKGDRARAYEFSNNFISITVLVSMTISVLGMVFSKQIGVFIAPDVASDTQELIQKLIVIVLPTTIFTTLAYAFVGILQSLGEFNIPAIISMVSNVVIIGYLLFFDNIYGLCVAMLVGWAMQFVIQIPSLVKKKYKFKLSFNFKDAGIKQAMILALPILISSWVQPISLFVNKRYASSISGGGPALDYANRFYIIVVGVFVLAITNYIFPALSKKAGVNDDSGFNNILVSSIRVMFLIITPIMVGMFILAEDIVMLVYGRGNFDKNSVVLTASALRFFSLGMIAYGINEILNKCFYSMKNAKLPMIASFMGIIVSVVLSSLSVSIWNLGVKGLAFSSSISVYVVAIILFLFIQHKNKFMNINVVTHVLKVFVSAALMSVFILAVKPFICELNIILRLLITIVGGGIVYVIGLILFKVKEVWEVIRR